MVIRRSSSGPVFHPGLLDLAGRYSFLVDPARRAHPKDNALAESIISLYRTELTRKRGPWKNLDHVEYATLEWVDWFNHRWLFETIGHIPLAEFEDMFYRGEVPADETGLKQLSLH